MVFNSTYVPSIDYKNYENCIEEYNNPLRAIKLNYLKKISCDVVKEENEPYDTDLNNKINNKHDKLFKDLLSNKEEAVKFINKYLHLRVKIKKEDIESYKSGYITRIYQNRETDVIYKMKNRNIFFLIEHQSTIDITMPYRILNYSVAIMNQAVEKEKMRRKEYKYPRVIAVVLYTGKRKWKAEVNINNIQESLAGYKGEEEGYKLVDVNEYSKEELLEDNLMISKAMLMEKSRSKEETIRNVEAITNKIIEDEEELGEYLLDVMEKYILEKNMGEEISKKVEEIREKRGGKKDMLNVVKVIQEENSALRKEGYVRGVMEVAKNLIKRNMDIKEISEITGLNIRELKEIKNKLNLE